MKVPRENFRLHIRMGFQISELVPVVGHSIAVATLGATREFIVLAAALEFLARDGSRNVLVDGEVKLFVPAWRCRDPRRRRHWVRGQRLVQISCKIGIGAWQEAPLVKRRSQWEVDVEGKEVEARDRLARAELLGVQK
jgi:hypothetical protein